MRHDRTIPELLRDLVDQFSNMFRDEFALARAELGDKVSQAGSGVFKLVFALVLGLGAVVILLLAAVEGLSGEFPRWLAALIVGGAAAVVAGLFAAMGQSDLKAKNLAPTRTIESVKEDARFAKEKVS